MISNQQLQPNQQYHHQQANNNVELNTININPVDSLINSTGLNPIASGVSTNNNIAPTQSSINEISIAISDNINNNSPTSIFQILNEKLVNFYLTVKTSETEIQNYERFLIFAFYIYMYWVNLVFPTLSSERSSYSTNNGDTYPNGQYASWVYRVLNYPITLSLDAIDYNAKIALTTILIVMYFIFLVILITEFRTLKGKTHSRIRIWRQRVGVIVAILSPLTLYMMSNFIDCNTENRVFYEREYSYVNMLRRHDTIACFGNENLSFFIITCILMVIIVFATSCAILFMPNNANSALPFVSYDNLPVMLNISSIGFEIFVKFLIPHGVIYLRGVLHIVSALVQLIVVIKIVPLFKRSLNGVYTSTVSGRLGSSIGVFISQLAFTFMEKFEEETALGLMGLTLSLMIIGAIIGGVGMEVYTRTIVHRMRVLFRSKMSNMTTASYDEFQRKSLLEKDFVGLCTSEQKNLRNLNLFLRFAGEDKEDLGMAISFIKAVSSHKCLSSPKVLLTSALLVAYHWNDENSASFSTYILKKAKRFCNNTWTKTLILERMKEIEIYSSTKTNGINQVEIKCMLHDMENTQEELWAIHRMFWKEIISDFPNESKINPLISRATSLTIYCDEIFKHLITNFKHDKTVLRFYASYLENFKFDKETASEYFEQASQLEEEESRAQQIAKKNDNKLKIKYEKQFSTSFVPNSSDIRRNTMIEIEEEKFDGIETKGTIEKKHMFIRNALKTPYQSKVRNWALVGLAFFQIILLIVAFILCTYYGSLITQIPLSMDSCLPGTSPSSLMREVRMGQIYNELYRNQNPSQPVANSTFSEALRYFRENHKRRLKRILQYLQNLAANSISKFTKQMLEDYTSPTNPIVFPTPSIDKSDRIYLTSYKKNVSMSELTREFISITKLVCNWNPENYNETIKSYEFMYIFLNRRAASNANGLFCTKFQKRKRAQNAEIDEVLRLYLFISTALLITVYGTFLVIFRIGMLKSSQIVKLFNKIPKDLVGSIYHDLQKRTTQEVKHLRNVISPKFMSLSIGFVSLFIFSLCISLMYVETNLNVDLSSQAMINIDQATSMIRASVRLNVRLSELFAFYGIDSGRSVNDPAIGTETHLKTYHSENRLYIAEAQIEFSHLLFGSSLTSPIFNRYTGVDEIITAPLTCINGTCYDLQELVAQVLHLCAKFNEDILNPHYAKSPDTFLYYLTIFNLTDEMVERLLELLTSLSSTSSSKVISIVFFVFGFISLPCMHYFICMFFHTTDYDITTMRTFLNYIPIDYLDSNENLKNFILSNSLSKSQKRRKTKYNDAIKNLLNSMVEGAITCNERGEVTFINIAAQKMFGKSAVDVLGLPCTTLFDQESHETMKKATRGFKYHTNGEQNEQLGEILEIECVRKNLSKFPAKVSIFGTEISSSSFVVSIFIKDITMEKKQNTLLAEEKKNSENLLRNILPEAVATKLKNGETFIAERFSDITCYFSDMMNPSELVLMLNRIVNGFDDLVDKYNLEKIKTIGDSYFCVGGLHGVNAQSDHPERALKFAIDTLTVIRSYNSDNLDSQLNIRIGLNTGGVIAGVIGRKKFAYDLWGDTINTSSRMESSGVAGRIQLSRSTYERTYDLYEFEERIVEVKGKGECKTYLVKEKHHVNPIVSPIDNDLDEISVSIDQGEIV